MHFLRGFGKVLGLDMNVDVPTLGMLQEGLLNVGDSMGQVQDLLVKLLSLAVCDPGLPPGQKVSFDTKLENFLCLQMREYFSKYFNNNDHFNKCMPTFVMLFSLKIHS